MLGINYLETIELVFWTKKNSLHRILMIISIPQQKADFSFLIPIVCVTIQKSIGAWMVASFYQKVKMVQ